MCPVTWTLTVRPLFNHISSAILPATRLSPALKALSLKIHAGGGRPDSFSTFYNLRKTLHPTSIEWLTIETGDFDSTLRISLYTNLPTRNFCYPYDGGLPVQVGALCLSKELFSLVVIILHTLTRLLVRESGADTATFL